MSLPVRGAWIEIAICDIVHVIHIRRSPCGERGLKSAHQLRPTPQCRRSPCGERGLKCFTRLPGFSAPSMSLPVRGAWIEMQMQLGRAAALAGRSPCGERGLKYPPLAIPKTQRCRSPCGERGLKCKEMKALIDLMESLPVRGAWIEIIGFINI